MRWKWILGIIAVVILALVVTAYIILSRYDYNKFKPLVTKAAKEATGRELTIRGDLGVKIGLTPTVVAGDITFQNAPWGSRPDLATIKGFEVKVALIPLIWGHIKVWRLILVEPDILVETDTSGQSNLKFEPAKKAEPKEEPPAEGELTLPPFDINKVEIEKGIFTYKDGRSGKTQVLMVDRLVATGEFQGPVELTLDGTYDEKPLHVTGTLGPLVSLTDPKKPWPLDVTAKTAGVTVAAKGSIKDLFSQRGLDLTITVQVKELAELEEFFGKPVPLTGPFDVSGRATDPAARTYRVSDLKLGLGESDLTGIVEVNLAGKRPRVMADLSSQAVDLRPLLQKDKKKGVQTDKSAGRKDKVFPNDPLSLDSLKLVDADVKIHAGQVLLPRLALNDLSLHMVLNNGHLTIDPLHAQIGGGTLDSRFDMRPEGNVGVLEARVQIDQIDLAAMLEELEVTEVLEGRLDGEVDVEGRGGSIAELMAGLNGKATIVMGNGRIDNDYIGLLGAEITTGFLRLLNPASEKVDTTKVNCFVCRFDVKDGLADSTALVIDTDQMSVIGDGMVNLGTEKLNVGLKPSPKEGVGGVGLSLTELARPFRLGGTLARPSLEIDPTGTALIIGKGAGGVALFGPVGIAAALLSTSPTDENPCLTAIEAAEKGVKVSRPSAVEKTGKGVGKGAEGATKGAGGLLKKLFGK